MRQIEFKAKKVDLSNVPGEVFYKYIYPMSAREFLFGVRYEEYAEFIGAKFILHPEQWEEVLMQWEFKEGMLRLE